MVDINAAADVTHAAFELSASCSSPSLLAAGQTITMPNLSAASTCEVCGAMCIGRQKFPLSSRINLKSRSCIQSTGTPTHGHSIEVRGA